MFTHRFTKPLASTLVAAAFGIGALATAATASAGVTDDAFVDVLAGEGIVYDSPALAAGDGRLVCDQLGAGAKPISIANQVLDDTDLSEEQAIYLVAASVVTYCPQFEDVPFA